MSYPNDFERTHLASQIVRQYGETPQQELERLLPVVAVAGRLMAVSALQGAHLARLRDQSAFLDILISAEATGKRDHAAFASWSPGDILGVTGTVCRLADGQLAVRAHEIERLVQPLHRLPEQPGSEPYLRLLLDADTRARFALRSGLITAIRAYMRATTYLEVETPILQAEPDARATQFRTHHNALDRELYLRSAGDLYLKRLLVGGVEKVYEINRCFVQAAPDADSLVESTVLELCAAYATFQYMMAFVEQLLARSIGTALGTNSVPWRGRILDFARRFEVAVAGAPGALEQPTFVVDEAAGRFEVHVAGCKVAAGGAEVNDPEALADGQDADFVRAVEYGLPPAAGLTLWIDRLVMALTDAPSLADVALFHPHGGR